MQITIRMLLVAVALTIAGPVRGQAIDLEAQREAIASIGANWRFHAGDDARWSQPDFDDSGWKTIQPAAEWTKQGYPGTDELAWFRFRVKVPPTMTSLVIQMPRVDRSYQLFADGRLIAQVGSLPPERPRSVASAARVFTIPVHPGAQGQEITFAIRLWQELMLNGVRSDVLLGRTYAGDASTVLRQFTVAKQARLLSMGSEYTQDIIILIVCAATLMLYRLTRQDFYLWFALNLALDATLLPIHLASQHFAWDFMGTVDLYTLQDFLAGIALTMFLLGAVNLRTRRAVGVAVLLCVLMELGPLLLVPLKLPLSWADGSYFIFSTALRVLLFSYLVRGWRRGSADARLLLLPYTLSQAIGMISDLGHFLINLGVPQGQKLLTADIAVLHEPFAVTLRDVSVIISLLGFLAVLVYRFARTSRDQQRLAAALQAAHDVQHRLVPVNIPALGGLHTEVVYLAAEEVGGDFCQVLPRGDGSILVAIGDVSGKGLQAAMVGAVAVGALRSMADEDLEPGAALERLNHVLLRTENAGFTTCLCLKLTAAGEVTMANAGHLPPYLDGVELALEPALPLGLVADVAYAQRDFQLPPRARLTLLSDGVVEARALGGELFGFERTSQVSRLPASEIAARANLHGQEDDITVITLDWRAPEPLTGAA